LVGLAHSGWRENLDCCISDSAYAEYTGKKAKITGSDHGRAALLKSAKMDQQLLFDLLELQPVRRSDLWNRPRI
jgi:hypothetical protein